MTIFQTAAQKLTLWYVGALLAVCLIFSAATYTIASSRLEHGARNQAAIIEKFDGRTGVLIPEVKLLRDKQIHQDRQQLIRTLLLANLIILILGAYFSHRFAKHTLQPIEEAHEAQTRFTTDASHELRTPLAVMQAEIEVALRDKKLQTARAKQVLQSNLEEIARLRTLSEQLLDLTRLDSRPLKKVPLQLGHLVKDELGHLQKQWPALVVTTNLEPDITVLADKQLLHQLLAILIDNTVKYAGGKPPMLSIELAQQAGQALLTATDQGMGIKATELPHIFDRFYRGTTAHGTIGHGLGLSLAKQIVTAHGGNISASSRPGKGTTFQIRLPVAPTP